MRQHHGTGRQADHRYKLGALLAILVLLLGVTTPTGWAGDYGDFSADTRLRFETAEIDGLEDADNWSARLRLGYTTPDYHGLKAMAEGEFTGVADQGSYNAAGVHGDRSKAVIADPKNVQLDQATISYTFEEDTDVAVGRQLINLNNQRFVGAVAWRQNRQTFDAATIKNTSIDNLELFYAYVDNVVRIFGSEAPGTGGNAEEAGSESHLINASYQVCDEAKLTAYAFLLDLDDIPATLSSDTVGIIAEGSTTTEDGIKIGYYGEYAYQEDGGGNPNDYDADYYHISLNGAYQGVMAEVGYEVLGSDTTRATDTNGAPIVASFTTPLATAHKFNGFADRFLATPAVGLEDAYIMLGYKLKIKKAGPLIAKVWYHDFSSDKGSVDLGEEWDAVLVKPFEFKSIPGTFKAMVKLAFYEKGDVGADTDRVTADVNYSVRF